MSARTDATDRFTWERAVRADRSVTGWRMLLLLTVATFLDNDGTGYASLAKLAAALGVNEKTVRRQLDWAMRAGWLVRTMRGHRLGDGTVKSSEWALAVPAHVDTEVPGRDEGSQLDTQVSGRAKPQLDISASSTGHPGVHPQTYDTQTQETSFQDEVFKGKAVVGTEQSFQDDVFASKAVTRARPTGEKDQEPQERDDEKERAGPASSSAAGFPSGNGFRLVDAADLAGLGDAAAKAELREVTDTVGLTDAVFIDRPVSVPAWIFDLPDGSYRRWAINSIRAGADPELFRPPENRSASA